MTAQSVDAQAVRVHTLPHAMTQLVRTEVMVVGESPSALFLSRSCGGAPRWPLQYVAIQARQRCQITWPARSSAGLWICETGRPLLDERALVIAYLDSLVVRSEIRITRSRVDDGGLEACAQW